MAATATTAAFDAQARTSDRRNGPGRVFAPQRTAPGEGQGQRGGGDEALRRQKAPPPGSGRESCWLSTSRCCRWWNSRWMWTLSFAFLCLQLSSRLPKCPSLSFLFVLFSERLCLSRSWWNSWLKCQRFCPIPCSSSRLPSRSSIFRFRAVEEVLVEVFKVFPKDRVPQRLPVSRPSFLLVEVFMGFPKDRVPQRLPVSRPSFPLVEVFQGFPKDRGSAASAGEQTIVVDRLQGFPRGQGSTASAVEQTFSQAPHRSMPRACESRLGGLPAQGRHDEWVCVVDVENDGEYFWNWLDNSTCWRLPRGVKHRWCLLPSGLYRDVVTQVNYRVLPSL